MFRFHTRIHDLNAVTVLFMPNPGQIVGDLRRQYFFFNFFGFKPTTRLNQHGVGEARSGEDEI